MRLPCRHEKDTAVILGKEQARLQEEAEAAAAAAERMEEVLAAVSRAQSEPMRCPPARLVCQPACMPAPRLPACLFACKLAASPAPHHAC